jgi:hypothetical protein
MNVSRKSITFLASHLHLLSAEKQAVARYICESWTDSPPRLPQGIAVRASIIYGFSVHDAAATQRVARELFLESAKLLRVQSVAKS